jgi:hypothetical protein
VRPTWSIVGEDRKDVNRGDDFRLLHGDGVALGLRWRFGETPR